MSSSSQKKRIAQAKLDDIAVQIRGFRSNRSQIDGKSYWRSAIIDLDSAVELILSFASNDIVLSGFAKEFRKRWSNDEVFHYLATYRDQDTHIKSRETPEIAEHSPAKIRFGNLIELEGCSNFTIGDVVQGGVSIGGLKGNMTDGRVNVSVTNPLAEQLLTTKNGQVLLPQKVVNKKGVEVTLPKIVSEASDPALEVIMILEKFLTEWAPSFGLRFRGSKGK